MSKVQEYLKLKRIKEQGLPVMYIVHSSPEEVKEPYQVQVEEIIKGTHPSLTYGENNEIISEKTYDKYILLHDGFPKEILIAETSNQVSGYGSGFGNLWGWTLFCTLSKDEADEYYKKELQRVSEKYLERKTPLELILSELEKRLSILEKEEQTENTKGRIAELNLVIVRLQQEIIKTQIIMPVG